MKTMLDILNVSSGRELYHRAPVSELRPHRNLRQRRSGINHSEGYRVVLFKSHITDGCRHGLAKATLDLLEAFDDENPDSDQTEIYPFIRDDQASE